MEGHSSLPVSLHLELSPSFLLFLFCPSYQLSVCCLCSPGRSRALFFSLFSQSPWESMLWKDLIIWWLSSCFFLSPDLSVYPARTPFHCCYVFWASPHRLFYHLISSEDEYCWRYFPLFFPAPCCWVLSLLLCPTKRLITVLPLLWKVLFLWINGMTDGERVRERTEERMSSMPIQS